MKFEKVTLSQYMKDSIEDTLSMKIGNSLRNFNVRAAIEGKVYCKRMKGLGRSSIEEQYEEIKLPRRATKRSAGHDFYAPYPFTLYPGDTIRIATGIRAKLDPDKVLLILPRSGHGFKARVQLDNTCGVIDADYYDADNEGDIILKLTNDSHEDKVVTVKEGDGIAQGIITTYYTTEDDDVTEERVGGFGSTTKEEN